MICPLATQNIFFMKKKVVNSAIKKKIRGRALLFTLKRRHRKSLREMQRRHYPKKWILLNSLVGDDIDGYLKYEGKNKHDDLELLKTLYGSIKDIRAKITRSLITFTVFTIYIICYAVGVDLSFNFAGVRLDKNVEILTAALVTSAFLRYYIAMLESNYRVVKSALESIIYNNIDSQFSGIITSAFLYFDNSKPYRSGGNPKIIPIGSFSIFTAIFGVTALIFYVLIEFFIFYFYYEAFQIIYSEWRWNITIFWTIFAGSCSLIALSLQIYWQIYLPYPYRDWTTNSRIELLDQVNPIQANKLRSEISSESKKIKKQTSSIERILRSEG